MSKVTHGKVSDFTPDPRNANQGTARGLRLLEDSLRESGAGRSLLADKNGVLLAGNKTAERAVDIGLENAVIVETDGSEVVIVKRTDLDINTPEGRAMAYRDNRVGELSLSWQPEQLIADMQAGLFPEGLFETEELEALIAAVKETPPDDPGAQVDKAAELQVKWQTERGQVWQIGKHRLMCGDSTSREDVERLMCGVCADIALTDPPYGIKRDEGFEGFGGFGTPIARRQYADDWDGDRPVKATFDLILENVKNAIVFGGNFFADLLPRSTHWIVWDKLNTMPTFGDCELMWTSYPRHSVKKITLQYNGLIGKEQDRYHPTQKPSALFVKILDAYTADGSSVLDSFLGSGTTMVAAEQTGRICYGMEIEPKYCAVTLDRLARMGLESVLISNTQEF